MTRHWRIVRLLGHGLSGTVYEVREICGQNRRGALKVHCGDSVKATEEDFKREIRFVEALSDSHYTPVLYDRGTWGNDCAYVMEYADKLPLELPRKALLSLVDRVAEALAHLAERHVVYGDVKPNNLGLVRGKVVLLDLGSAREEKAQADNPLSIGTPHYRAPEIVRGEPTSHLTDIYSLGVTLGELCRDRDARAFAPLARRATATDPAARPQSFADFRRELRACETSDRRSAARWIWRIAAVAIACFCATNALLYFYRRVQVQRNWHDWIATNAQERIIHQLQKPPTAR